jgi:hypothetical protein
MTTALDKTLKRAITINEQAYVAAISPSGVKLTLKGRRNGVEMSWDALLANAAPSDKVSRDAGANDDDSDSGGE